MKRQHLKEMLAEKGVPSSYYNLDGIGRTDERFCLEATSSGWRVYYSERGINTTDRVFVSEDDACLFIYEQLV